MSLALFNINLLDIFHFIDIIITSLTYKIRLMVSNHRFCVAQNQGKVFVIKNSLD